MLLIHPIISQGTQQCVPIFFQRDQISYLVYDDKRYLVYSTPTVLYFLDPNLNSRRLDL